MGEGIQKMDKFLKRQSPGGEGGSPQKKGKILGEDVEVVGGRKVNESPLLVVMHISHMPTKAQVDDENAGALSLCVLERQLVHQPLQRSKESRG